MFVPGPDQSNYFFFPAGIGFFSVSISALMDAFSLVTILSANTVTCFPRFRYNAPKTINALLPRSIITIKPFWSPELEPNIQEYKDGQNN